MTSQAKTRSQLLSRVEEGFEPIQQLHKEAEGLDSVEGVDSPVLSNIMESINTAYESLAEARQMLTSNT